MTALLIRPLDPLVFGDSRSVGLNNLTVSRALPPPSQLAGVVRTRFAADEAGAFRSVNLPELLTKLVRGPLAALLDTDGGVESLLVPRPRDALLLGEPPTLHPLVPLEVPEGAVRSGTLAPVGLTEGHPEKPGQGPDWWRWARLRAWLVSAASAPWRGDDGVMAPLGERRLHVSIDADTGTAAEGQLFEVEGRRWVVEVGERESRRARELALVAWVDDDVAGKVGRGVGALGGERRLAAWSRVDVQVPAIPDEVLASARAGAVRLVLATPACFEGGSLPGRGGPLEGVEVVGLVNDRADVVSGWDFALNRPKATRRLLPAGSVLFLRLPGAAGENERFVREHWFQAVSDDEQARRDGFGLALFGTWSGSLHPFPPMETP